MAYTLWKTVFGFTAGSTTVQYKIVHKDGTTEQTWTHTGVSERAASTSKSVYGVTASFSDSFEGNVFWRSSTAATKVASEEINPQYAERIDAKITTRLSSTGYTTPPTTSAIADAVWDETLAGHAGLGSAGLTVSDGYTKIISINSNVDVAVSSRLSSTAYSSPPSAGTIADAVWDENSTAHGTAKTYGDIVDDLRKHIKNKVTVSSTKYTQYEDNGTSTAWTHTMADDGTTVTRGVATT